MAFNIANRRVGPGQSAFVILEAGINHNGDFTIAQEMVRTAKRAGADAIKFQTFKADEFVGNPDLMFTYQSQGQTVTESMLEMFRRYEFTREEWFELKRTCDKEGIIFLSTPQNLSDLELLLEIGVPALKVGSDDFTNLPLIKKYASTGLPLLVSCGMADLSEVHEALNASGAFDGASVLLMLCTSQYPTPPESANLMKLRTLAGAFPGLSLGFSDHTQGAYAAAIACGLGACAFEKHFTLDQGFPGPDHWFSENPVSATEWVVAIRTAEKLLGSPFVVPTGEERDMRRLARRSVTVIKDVVAGDIFNEENLGLRRPGDGLAPKMIEQIWGKSARVDLKQGAQIKFEDVGHG
jgi:N,N'-diacetyllegionaminate synthase